MEAGEEEEDGGQRGVGGETEEGPHSIERTIPHMSAKTKTKAFTSQ